MAIQLDKPEAICQALDTTARQDKILKLKFGQRLPLKKLLTSYNPEADFAVSRGSLLSDLPVCKEFIASAQTRDDLAQRVSSLQRDLITSPQEFKVRLASEGMTSPPLLVDFSRLGIDQKRYLIQYVQKWLPDIREIRDSHSYQRLCLPGGFKVPRTAGFDFTEKTFIDTAGRVGAVADEIFHRLSASLKTLNKRPQDKTSLMMTDFIQGKPVQDFITKGDYSSLSPEQKSLFWRRIGQLACADYVLGHTDRLIKAEDNTRLPSMSNFSFGANLGNILVEDRTFDLYAIDNGLDHTLSRSVDFNLNNLTQAVIDCFQISLVDFNPNEVKSVSSDLKTEEVYNFISQGIAEMQTRIKC